MAHDSVLDAIGGTPLVRLHRLSADLRPRILVKLEQANPGGSVKDRAALSMVRAAEDDGSLRPGGTIVETTSGNTGIGLALVAAQRGYGSVIFSSRAIADEKIRLLRAYGAEVRLTDTYLPKEHPDSLGSQAARFAAETPGAWRADQYDNPANPAAHELTTGPEIWTDTEGAVTHLVATVGTGGTISGTGRALKSLSGGRVRVIAADPEASVYSGGDGGAKHVEGAGHARHPDAEEDVWPEAFDTTVVDEYIAVSDRESFATARRAAREEGLLLGGSGGTALAAALRLARGLREDDVVVVLVPDSGRNALSTFYDDDWLADRGFVLVDGPEEAAPVPVVRDVLDGPAARIPRSLTVADAVTRLTAGGVGADSPLLLVHRDDDGEAPIPPAEVVGITTPRRLRLALAAALGDGIVTGHAAPRPPGVGIGRDAVRALARTDETAAGWSTAAVLEDGRIVGTVSRDILAAHAAGSLSAVTSSGQPPTEEVAG